MCQKLRIELIGANSLQAQGRVERRRDTHQDRLSKKMRLKQIATYEQANAFLVETYLPAHNARYAIAASHAWTFMDLWPSTWTWMTCSVGAAAHAESGLGSAVRLAVVADRARAVYLSR